MCKELLTTATAKLSALGPTFGIIRARHPERVISNEGLGATSKQDAITAQLSSLNGFLWRRTPTPPQDTMDTFAPEHNGLPA